MNPVAHHEAKSQLGFTFETPKASSRRVYTVAELVGEVRESIEREYADLWVEGEISNLRAAPSGHIYFTLKDGEAQLPAVLFRRQASLLRFRPEDGLHILARGKISIYEQRGQMQLIAEFLEPVGAGSLQIAFEQLKAKLQLEGLFDPARKRPLPAFPRCIGIVTSPTGAVIQDFLNIATRRHAALNLLLYPALVQGTSAAAETAAGIAYFNRTQTVDIIVLARGGGSLEDLAPYNSELLARAIADSALPVVSAIGHETDFTIADFVADLRAPTPSAAAELLTEAQHKVAARVDDLDRRLRRAARYKLMQARERLSRLGIEATSARLTETFSRRQQRIDELRFRLHSAWQTRCRQSTHTLASLTARLLRQDATHRLRHLQHQLAALDTRLTRATQAPISAGRGQLRSLHLQLSSLSPLAVLNRGYALVYSRSGDLLKTAEATKPGDTITTRFAHSSLQSTVLERANHQ